MSLGGNPMLTPEEVKWFKRLVLEVYGIELSDSEVLDQGGRLVELVELLIKSRPKLANESGNLDKNMSK